MDLLDDQLDPLTVADKLKHSCPFMHADFVKDFMRLFPEPEDMIKDEARILLLCIALYHRLTMYRIECRHASIRRNLVIRGCGSVTPEWANLSADWVLMRQRIIENLCVKMRMRCNSAGADDAANSADADDDVLVKGNCIGPCRAWVSEFLRSPEARAIPDVSLKFSMAVAGWQAIKSERGRKYLEMVEKGRVMTATAARGVRVPKKPSEVATRALVPVVDHEQAALERLADLRRAKLQAGRDKAAQHKQLVHEFEQALVDTSMSMSSTRQALPAQSPDGGSMAHPHHSIFAMTVGTTLWAPAMAEKVGEAFAKMSLEAKEAMLQTWRDQHVLLRDADTQEYDVPPPVKRAACYYAGFCLCSKPWLRKCVGLLQSVCRREFRKGTELQQILLNGLAFLNIASPCGTVDVWLHLSHEDRSVWRAAVRPMVRDESGIRQIRASAVGRVALIPQGGAFQGLTNWWKALQGCDFRCCHSLVVYTACAHGDASTEFGLPISCCLVEPVFGHEPIEFWSPGLAKRGGGGVAWPSMPRGMANLPPDPAPALQDQLEAPNGADAEAAAPPLALQDQPESDRESHKSDHSQDSWVDAIARALDLGDDDDDNDDAAERPEDDADGDNDDARGSTK